MSKLTRKRITSFQRKVYSHYKTHGRIFPWRKTKNPYRILVSEVMLQQTQADRVIPYYKSFLKRFPTIQSLSHTSNRDILKIWQGLGYNRRALYLKHIAEIIIKKYNGKIPRNPKLLEDLPGIGPNTAGAVLAFAFNKSFVFIETNIRSVFIHEFFPRRKKVPDAELLRLIEQTLDYKDPREWYWALMDYGVMLKATYQNPSRRSKHHTKQSRFQGSDRQIRGQILRILTKKESISKKNLYKLLGTNQKRLNTILTTLRKEKLIRMSEQTISI